MNRSIHLDTILATTTTYIRWLVVWEFPYLFNYLVGFFALITKVQRYTATDGLISNSVGIKWPAGLGNSRASSREDTLGRHMNRSIHLHAILTTTTVGGSVGIFIFVQVSGWLLHKMRRYTSSN